ncbi:hypothetical protein ACHAWF_013495 [Thalassiosira exigua]
MLMRRLLRGRNGRNLAVVSSVAVAATYLRSSVRRVGLLRLQVVSFSWGGDAGAGVGGKGDGTRFFWEDAGNCHVVEDVCRRKADAGGWEWFYFAGEGEPRRQPSVELRVEEWGRGTRKDFRVSSSEPKPTLRRIRGEGCALSPAENHVVLQSEHNGMVGEFYSRSLFPLGVLFAGLDHAPDDRDRADLQYYVHFAEEDSHLLDAHRLFLGAMYSDRPARDWSEPFDAEEGEDNRTESSSPGCECYRRLVFCGYRQHVQNCGLERLDIGSTDALCRKGLDLRGMQRMLGNETALDLALREAGVRKARHRRRAIEFARNEAPNIALGRSATASSEEFPAEDAFDGNGKTRWSSLWSDDQFLEVNLGEPYVAERVVIVWEVASARSYDIQVSMDGANWTTVWGTTGGREGMGTVESRFAKVTCQFVRMQGRERATSFGYSIYELEVYGAKVKPSSTVQLQMEVQEKIILAPDPVIVYNKHPCGACSGEDGCLETAYSDDPCFYANLRDMVTRNIATNYPSLDGDVKSYRSKILGDAPRALHKSEQPNRPPFRDWKIVGLTQRVKRRRWLNLDKVVSYCNARYFEHGILCVEVNVERLPSSLDNGGGKTREILTPEYEQILMHRSLDALIGIHGAQLTQAVLMPKNSTVVELLPWVPKEDYFKREVWGEWVQTTDNPTPLGIIYHGSDLNHLGYPLNRRSVPLCQNASNAKMMHSKHQTELEHCLLNKYSNEFRWDERNFTVATTFIDRFIGSFLAKISGPEDHSSPKKPLCSELNQSGKVNNLVLYNVWCQKDNNSLASLEHFYWN